MTGVQILTLVIAILGLTVATCSLTWNIVQFKLQGARAKVTAELGTVIEGGLVHMPANTGAVKSIQTARSVNRGSELMAGVSVINRGRPPLHVVSWAFKSLPGGASFAVPAEPGLSTTPTQIAPGNGDVFVAPLQSARMLWETVGDERQRIVCVVSTGDDRQFVTGPLPTELFL